MKRAIIAGILLAFSISLMAQKSAIKQAEKALSANQPKTAQTAIDQATKHPKTSNSWKAWKLRGDIYTQLVESLEQPSTKQDPAQVAYDSYSKALELAKEDQTQLRLTQVGLSRLKGLMLSKGLDFSYNGEEQKAMTYFKLGVIIGQLIDEKSGELHAMMASLYMQDAQFQEAADAYVRSVEDGYNLPEQMSNALSALNLAQSPKYETFLNQYRSEYPDDINLKINETDYRIGQAQFDKAEVLLKELVEEEPFNTNYRYFLGMVQLNMDKEEGLEHLNVKLKQDPFHLPSLELLASHYLNKGLNANLKLLDLEEESDGAKQLITDRNESFNQFVAYGERIIKLNPESKIHLSALVDAYNVLGDEENATRIMRKIRLLDN